MAKRSVVSASQHRALAILSELRFVANDLYLAGGVGIAMHLGHRTSIDLDFFSRSAALDLDQVQTTITESVKEVAVEVIGRSDATLHMRFGGADLDIVRYPYPLLVKPHKHEPGIYLAGLRDLAAMKLAAIATRGIRRDFWDLHAILTSGRGTLRRALDDYAHKFGVKQSDLYHTLRGLSWFEDAERDEILPRGLTAKHWSVIRAYFEAAARKEIERRARLVSAVKRRRRGET